MSSQHAIMPEDEVGVADHLFTIDYVPSGPEAFFARTRCSTRRSRRSGRSTR